MFFVFAFAGLRGWTRVASSGDSDRLAELPLGEGDLMSSATDGGG